MIQIDDYHPMTAEEFDLWKGECEALVCDCGNPRVHDVGATGWRECSNCNRLVVGPGGRELLRRRSLL